MIKISTHRLSAKKDWFSIGFWCANTVVDSYSGHHVQQISVPNSVINVNPDHVGYLGRRPICFSY